MANTILDGVKGLKKTFNLYAMTLGVLGLGRVIEWLNDVFSRKQIQMKIFDFVVHPEYVSAIIGLLWGLFLVVLFLQVRHVSSGLKAAWLGQSTLKSEIIESLHHFPWIACPYHMSKLGLVLFWSLLGVGCMIVAIGSIGHISGTLESLWRINILDIESNLQAFKKIGYVNVAILMGGFILLWYIKLDIGRTRKLLQNP